MRIHHYINTIVAAALLLASASAAAQYVWVDEKGARTYSDRPPPPGVPAARILKAPRGMQQIMAVAAAPAPKAAPAPAGGAAPMTPAQELAAREEDFRKRREQSAEKAKKDAEDARVAATNRNNCEALRTTKARLESGERIQAAGSPNPREVMDDLQRSAALAKANRDLASCLSQ